MPNFVTTKLWTPHMAKILAITYTFCNKLRQLMNNNIHLKKESITKRIKSATTWFESSTVTSFC